MGGICSAQGGTGDAYKARVGWSDGTGQFEDMGINEDNVKMDPGYVK